MFQAIILALLPLSFLVAEVKIPDVKSILSEGKAPWELLLDKGDAESLEKAKALILSLKGEDVLEGLIAMMQKGLGTVDEDVLSRVEKASPLNQMKIAHYARISKSAKYVPVLLDWAEKSTDTMVRELAIRTLGDCGGAEVIARLEAMIKKGGLDPFVESATKASLEKLKKTDS